MKPHLTEKSYLLATATKPAYTFLVSATDSTASIIKHLKERYGKDVTDVRFVANAAKQVARKGIRGTVTRRRKAIITLTKGQTLAAFDIPSSEKETPKKEKDSKTKE